MNIKEAKDQIKNAMTAYFTKDQFGNYVIPIERQRPVFLLGPPGIGKTAIMEQIAQELDVGLVSYSMTHHTRQSALGLPFISRKEYGGKEYDVSEYTMSEIIASVYDMIEDTGHKEGILFLDEINCVSETLSPVMLQFLQYKIFGRHKVPEGWIVVTAGNPPEYNNSVHEFDIVTLDRLKRMDVEPDYEIWKEYAYKAGVHASIITYLDIKTDNFYKIESTVDGKSFVTARGWSDLSDMIKLYESNSIPVDRTLVSQYLQNGKVAKNFASYYDLFNKYKSDYQVDQILAGTAPASITERASKASFDERLSLLGLIIDAITLKTHNVFEEESTMRRLRTVLQSIRTRASKDTPAVIDEQVARMEEAMRSSKQASSLSADEEYSYHSAIRILGEMKDTLLKKEPKDAAAAFKLLKSDYDKRLKKFEAQTKDVQTEMNNAFKFCDKVFPGGQEMVILVTDLTTNYYASDFISKYGSEEYFNHNKELLFYERQKEIISELEDLHLDAK